MATTKQSINKSVAALSQGVGGARGADIARGARFGASVLGDGLGRLSENKDVQAGLAGFRQQAQGFSSKESTIKRDRALSAIGTQTQSQQRSLQAALARAGVRGGAAGKQIKDVQMSAVKARQEAEENLFLAEEQAKKEGQAALFKGASTVGSFDLGQAAKEKNILMQGGLGFAQMGTSERAAQMQANATIHAANIRGAAQCHTADAEVLMADGTYKRIDEIKIGDVVERGGRVKGCGVVEAESHLYKLGEEFVTASHLILHKGLFQTVASLGLERTLLPTDTLVYPLVTEFGSYVTKSGFINGDLRTEELSAEEEERKSKNG